MPGVPTGKACDACRKVKKKFPTNELILKCDEKIPNCSRCLRLGLNCIGSGQQRYKFQAQWLKPLQDSKHRTSQSPIDQPRSSSSTKVISRETACIDVSLTRIWPIVLPPCNEASAIASKYIRKIELTNTLNYNLAWTYGFFMFDIPQRLNTNEALDSAVIALNYAHDDYCTRPKLSQSTLSVKTLGSYSRALSSLRKCLDDPAKATSSETLCAVMILLICQNLNGQEWLRWTGHCEGAAKMLKARSFVAPRNNFEEQIILSLRGCVLFEGLFNENIVLEPHEWKSFIANEMDGSCPEEQLLQNLASVPSIIRRARSTTRVEVIALLRRETKNIYKKSQKILPLLRKQWIECPHFPALDELDGVIKRAYCQRAYGIGLLIVTILNWLLRALTHSTETRELLEEATILVNETLELAEQAKQYRPLAAGYIITLLTASCVAATNDHERLVTMTVLDDYRQDFPLHELKNFISELNLLVEKCQNLAVS